MTLTCNGRTQEQLAHALSAFFPETDIQWKPDRFVKTQNGLKAIMLAFVDNRAIQERLDDVCGPGNWRNSFQRWGTKGVLCSLEIRFEREDGSDCWTGKTDGADETDIEATKGGLSSSMKRAASQWGIGRYLYSFPDAWLDAVERNGRKMLKNWGEKPRVPAAFLPGGQPEQPRPEPQPEPQQGQQPPASAQAEPSREEVRGAPQHSEAQQTSGDPDWLNEDFKFGKHKGKTWRWFSEGTPQGERQGYMDWLVSQDPTKGDPKWHDANRERQRRASIVSQMIDANGGSQPSPPAQQQEEEYVPAEEAYLEVDDVPF